MSNATATPPKPPEVKAPAPFMSQTYEQWFGARAIDECFKWGRQAPRWNPKEPDKAFNVECYIGFWSNEMVCPPVIKPSLVPQNAVLLADCVVTFQDKKPIKVDVLRIITREVYDREEKEHALARRR